MPARPRGPRARRRRAHVRAPFATALLALCASGCGLWPTFPDSLLRDGAAGDAREGGGMDVPGTDAPPLDVVDAASRPDEREAATPGDAADDASTPDDALDGAARDASARDATPTDAPAGDASCGLASLPCCAGMTCSAPTLVCRAADTRCITCGAMSAACSAIRPCCAGLRCAMVLDRQLCTR